MNSGRLFVCIIDNKANVNVLISDRYGQTLKDDRNCQTLLGLDTQVNIGWKLK